MDAGSIHRDCRILAEGIEVYRKEEDPLKKADVLENLIIFLKFVLRNEFDGFLWFMFSGHDGDITGEMIINTHNLPDRLKYFLEQQTAQ